MTDTDQQPTAGGLREQARDLLARLTESYPEAFPPSGRREVRPLMVGIHKDLLPVVVQWGFDRSTLRLALTLHTRQLRYQQGIVNCAMRVDLSGADAGEVTEENRAIAQQRIEEIRIRREAARASRAGAAADQRNRSRSAPSPDRPRRARKDPSLQSREIGTRGTAEPAPAATAEVRQDERAPRPRPRTRERRKAGPVSAEALEALAARFNRR